MIDPTSLAVFIYLANHLHFGKTSRRFNISTPTLTRMIKQLEAQVNGRLFERNNRHVLLTKSGEKFRQFAEATLKQYGHVLEDIQTTSQQVQGDIKLYCSVTASYTLLPNLIKHACAKYPDINILLTIGNVDGAIDAVESGDADIAIATHLKTSSPKVLFKPLTTIPLIIVAPLQGEHAAGSLVSSPIILPRSGQTRSLIDQWFNQHQLGVTIYSEVAGLEGILSLVSVGLGLGVVPQLVYEKSSLKNQVNVLEPPFKMPELPVGICVNKSALIRGHINRFWTDLSN